MTTCVRCGLEQDEGELTRSGVCALPLERRDACRDRELANLRSLLRAQTRKLEEAAAGLSDPFYAEDIDREHVLKLIVSVLEALA